MLNSALENNLISTITSFTGQPPQSKPELSIADLLDTKIREIQQPVTTEISSSPASFLTFSPVRQHLISQSSDSCLKVWNVFTNQEILNIPIPVVYYDFFRLTFDYKFIIFSSDVEGVTIWDLVSDSEYLRVNCVETVLVESSDTVKFLALGCKNRVLRVWDLVQKSEVLFLENFGNYTVIKFFKDRYLAAGMDSGEIVLWELNRMSEFYRYRPDNSRVKNLVFMWNKPCIASTSSENLFTVHNFLSVKIEFSKPAPESSEFKVEYSSTGYYAAVLFPTSINCFNLLTNTLYFTIPLTESPVSYSISESGQHLAYCFENSPINLASTTKSRSIASQLNSSETIFSLFYSKDNSELIVGSSDNKIRKLDASSLKEKSCLGGHTDKINSLAVSVCGKYLVSASSDKSVKVWDLIVESELFSLYGHESEVLTADLSSDLLYVVSGCKFGLVKLWDFNKKTEVFTFQTQTGCVNLVKFTFDSRFIVSASKDCSLRIWSVSELKKEGTLSGHSRKICSIDICSDSKILVSGSKDYKILVWNFQEQKLEFSLLGHTGYILGLKFFLNNEYLASISEDCSLKIWNIFEKREEFTLLAHSEQIQAITIKSDNSEICTVDSKGEIQKLSLLNKTEVLKINAHLSPINSVAISPLMDYWASGSKDSKIKIWDLETGQLQFELLGHTESVNGLSFSRSGKLLGSASLDKTVKIWDIYMKKEVVSLIGHTESVYMVSFFNNEKFVASCSDDMSIRVWNISSGSKEFSLLGHSSTVYFIKVSFDDCFIISGSWDKTIKVWNLNEQKLDFTLVGHTGSINTLDITPDGRYIASGSDDRTIKIWNFFEKREEFTLLGHENYIYSVNLCSQGKYLVSSSFDTTIKIWNLSEKREELTLYGHSNVVNSVNISHNSELIASGSGDNTIRLWKIKNLIKERQGLFTQYYLNDKDKSIIIQEMGNEVRILEKLNNEKTGNIKKFDWKIFGDTERNSLLQQEFNEIKCFTPNIAFDQVIGVLQSNQFDYNLGNLLDLFENLSENTIGPNECTDSYFQPIIVFYNLIDCLAGNNFTNFNSKAINLIFSEYSYTVLHYWAHNGNIEAMSTFLTPSSGAEIRSDLFGKSPFFYSINKKHQKCTDICLNYLISIEESRGFYLTPSIFATRNDFQLIIKNSSKFLPAYLNLTLFSSNYIMIPTVQLPISHYFGNSSTPQLSDFIGQEHLSDSMPGVFRYLPFKIPSTPYSIENIEFLSTICECKNDQIFKTMLIQHIIDIQWTVIKPWASLYSCILLMNLLVFVLILMFDMRNLYCIACFCVINLFLFFWEIIQLSVCGISDYVKDPWNWLDVLKYLIIPYWVVLEVFESRDQYSTSLVAFLVLARGVTAFKIFDGTRYYLRLILRSLNNIKYFMIMFFYSTFCFGVLFTVSRGEKASFEELWETSWLLNFGENSNTPTENTIIWLNYAAHLLAIIMNVVLMLNLLISILGDSYEQFQIEKTLIDYREKLEYTLEIQKLIIWKRCPDTSKFLHILTSLIENDEGNDWEGRILYMEQKTDKSLTKLSKNIDKKLESTQQSLIESVEQELQKLENKMIKIETRLENKIDRIENKLIWIEGKEKEFDNNFQGLDEKLRAILKILSN